MHSALSLTQGAFSQVSLYQEPGFVCAALYLISEICKLKQKVKELFTLAEPSDETQQQSSSPAPPSSELLASLSADAQEPPAPNTGKRKSGEDTEHNDAADAPSPSPSSVLLFSACGYDPRKREPQFCKAETSRAWEGLALAAHWHPSVVKFATVLLQGGHIVYNGDPLVDFSQSAFLERFMYKVRVARVLITQSVLMRHFFVRTPRRFKSPRTRR